MALLAFFVEACQILAASGSCALASISGLSNLKLVNPTFPVLDPDHSLGGPLRSAAVDAGTQQLNPPQLRALELSQVREIHAHRTDEHGALPSWRQRLRGRDSSGRRKWTRWTG